MERVLPGSQSSLISDLGKKVGDINNPISHQPTGQKKAHPPFLSTIPGRARLVERACRQEGGLSVGVDDVPHRTTSNTSAGREFHR